MSQKILVIDDDPEVQDILGLRLKSAGYEVFTASAGLDGLNMVYKVSPDLIITDLMLPQMDGFHICRILKFDERYENVPIIMLTCRTEDKDVKLGLKCGANKYMTKPFDPETVLNAVRELLEEKINDALRPLTAGGS